jgi:hypothetical protein
LAACNDRHVLIHRWFVILCLALSAFTPSAAGNVSGQAVRLDLVLSRDGFAEVVERLGLDDDQQARARGLYEEYLDAVEQLARNVHQRVQDAGMREHDRIRDEYFEGQRQRGPHILETDVERIALEQRLRREMDERIAELDLRPSIYRAQAAGNRESFELLLALLEQVRGLCREEQLDRYERAERAARRRLWSDLPMVNPADFVIRDLILLIEAAKAPGGELASAYCLDSIAELDDETAAALAELRWSIDSILLQYEAEIDNRVQRIIRRFTVPPTGPGADGQPLVPGTAAYISRAQRRAAGWSRAYRIVERNSLLIQTEIGRVLSDEHAAQWDHRFRQALAPRLMREFWIEGPLQAWLDDHLPEEHECCFRVEAVVNQQRTLFEQERRRAFDLGVMCNARHGRAFGNEALPKRFRESRERVISLHETGLSIILATMPEEHRDRLRNAIEAARRNDRWAFGHDYLFP